MNTATPAALLRRLIPAATAALALACAARAHAAPAAPPTLLAQYDFENIPAFVPDWGAALRSTYKPATGWKTPFRVKLDADNPHSGEYALRFELLDKADGEKLVHSPSIAIPAHPPGAPARLVIHLYVRTRGIVPGGAGIRILERNAKGGSIRLLGNQKSLVSIPDSPGWKELTAGGALNENTRSVLFMVVMDDQPAPASVWIDDISVEVQPASPDQ